MFLLLVRITSGQTINYLVTLDILKHTNTFWITWVLPVIYSVSPADESKWIFCCQWLTWNTRTKLLWELWYEVIIDSVLHRSEDDDGPGIINWKEEHSMCWGFGHAGSSSRHRGPSDLITAGSDQLQPTSDSCYLSSIITSLFYRIWDVLEYYTNTTLTLYSTPLSCV